MLRMDNLARSAQPPEPEPRTRDFYLHALRSLDQAQVPYLIGGGYAMAHYTGFARQTKDLDLFCRPGDHQRLLDCLAAAGYRTEYFYPYWIAKALCGDAFIDVLYNSGNGLCPIDDGWFEHATEGEVHGYRAKIVPAEE